MTGLESALRDQPLAAALLGMAEYYFVRTGAVI